MVNEKRLERKWWEIVVKASCLIPGTISAIKNSIREHARTVYSKRCYPGVEFMPLSYAANNCSMEVPCRICEGSRLSNVVMGRHSYCGIRCFIRDSKIGKFCSIGNEVMIGMHLHPTQLVSTYPGFYHNYKYTINFHRNDDIQVTPADIKIGNDVWIGNRALIFGGITIGDGAIIGAGAVVTKDVEPYDIVAGVPAQMIRKRFPKHIVDRLLAIRWWDYDDEIIKRYSELFGHPETFIDSFGK